MENTTDKKCNNCGFENSENDDFCLGCGLELADANAAVDSSTLVVPAPVEEKIPITEDFTNQPDEQPVQSAAATLVLGDKSYPISGDKVFTIAREGSAVNPDLPVPQTAEEDISSFPLQVIVIDGETFVQYDGDQPRNYGVLKAIQPGERIQVRPGEAIVAGMGTLIFLV